MTLGFVVIGRNEAAHLADCIGALPRDLPIVYADSASTDDSLAIARSAGADTVALSAPPRLTAARGRNAGLAHLLRIAPETTLVHMVDGDVVLDSGWIEAAQTAICADPKLAAVFGQLRETHPEASVYNRLCDREWKIPPGRVAACGGIALFRIAAIQDVGGYADDIAAGEEPDLCLRMRQKGWEIMALADPMGMHDAEILHFWQWWKRAFRAGQAYAQHVVRNGTNSDPGWVRQVISISAWTVGVIVLGGLLANFSVKLIFLPAILWLAMICRIFIREHKTGATVGNAFAYAAFTMLAKFAQFQGMFDFSSRRAIQKIFGPSTR
jgi:GT2 family glycosyltransferase